MKHLECPLLKKVLTAAKLKTFMASKVQSRHQKQLTVSNISGVTPITCTKEQL